MSETKIAVDEIPCPNEIAERALSFAEKYKNSETEPLGQGVFFC